MKIGIVGAGAIGCFFAARLARAGHDVSVLARGATLAALREHGVRYASEAESFAAPVVASNSAADLGEQDVIILAVKSYSLVDVVPQMAPLIGATTLVLPALNGLPWWFFLQNGERLGGVKFESVDPSGVVESAIRANQIIGSVVFPACSCPEPGLVRHASGTRLVFGEPDGGSSERIDGVVAMMQAAGLAAEASADIRRDLWLKLLGNICFNPVSLLTGSPTDRMIDDPGIYDLFVAMMTETLHLGRQIGIDVDIDPVARIAITRKLGNVKTSMLQDVEAGRKVELDGIIGAPVELAARLGVDVPFLATIAALCKSRAGILSLLP